MARRVARRADDAQDGVAEFHFFYLVQIDVDGRHGVDFDPVNGRSHRIGVQHEGVLAREGVHFESKAVHGALGTEPLTGAVSMPIFQTATFRHPALGESTGFAYSRLENPTRQELERTMAILEGGIKGFAFSSGQAANMAVFSLLNPGDHWRQAGPLQLPAAASPLALLRDEIERDAAGE